MSAQKCLCLMVLIVFMICNSVNAMIVYDPTNWLENAATAANTAQQLVNETQQIKIELQNIQNYDGDTGRWGDIQTLLSELSAQMQQGQSLAYSMQNVDSVFQQKFPGFVSSENYNTDYKNWSQTALDTLRNTLDNAGLQAGQFNSEQANINDLKSLSTSAEGRMQALQVGNMIATQQVSQMQALRQLVVNQTNAQTAYMSYQVQNDAAIKAKSSDWVEKSKKDYPNYGSSTGFNANTMYIRE